jgi:hypothetical protein
LLPIFFPQEKSLQVPGLPGGGKKKEAREESRKKTFFPPLAFFLPPLVAPSRLDRSPGRRPLQGGEREETKFSFFSPCPSRDPPSRQATKTPFPCRFSPCEKEKRERREGVPVARITVNWGVCLCSSYRAPSTTILLRRGLKKPPSFCLERDARGGDHRLPVEMRSVPILFSFNKKTREEE